VDLETFFSVGPAAPTSAQDTFTNRSAELDAFVDSLAAQALDDPVGMVEDVGAPRRNVLVFYGMGGVGKTRLSKELARRYDESPSDTEQRASFRVDFDDGGASDLESVLLTIRATLGGWKSAWPAFDLAFAAYWERAHPGVPLQLAVNSSSAARRVGARLDLGNQLKDAIEGLLETPGGVLGIFTSASRLVGKSVKQRLTERRLMRDCPFFEPIIEAEDTASMRTYLGALLAWDLANHQRRRPARLVAFMDTWERVQQGAPHRGSMEDLLSRLVHLMPNVLFVITGRNRLRWANEDHRGILQWAGPEHWPYLADSVTTVEPRQHLVGGLSPEDADQFLRLRLVRNSEPAIPAEIREIIVGAADGLPLYLDVAAVRFAQLVASRVEPSPDDFGHPFPEVVMRLMRDLDADQRSLLRTASLVRRFDEDLLLAGVPALPDSALSRFIRRSLVRRHPGDWAPFSIHESLRDAVRSCDVAEDRWSDREWMRAINRLLEEIRRRVEPELQASGAVDRALLTGLFKEAFGLATRAGAVPSWLWVLAGRLQSLGALDVLAWTDGVTPEDSGLRPAATALTAIGRRNDRGPELTGQDLRACLADPRLDPVGRDYTAYWLAWMLDLAGRWDDAEQVRMEVAGGNGPFTPNARHALARGDWVCGRLARALEWRFDEDDPLQRYWRAGIHGRVEWILGRFDEAMELYAERLEAAERTGSSDPVANTLRTVGELRCFTVPGEQPESSEAVAIYRRVGSRVSEAESLVSLAIARAGIDPLDQVLADLDRTRPALRSAPHADVGEIFARCVHGDLDGARRARDRLIATRSGRAFRFWVAITGWWLGEPDADAEVDWLYGKADARERWLAVLTARRG
jgi:hypothetical protein